MRTSIGRGRGGGAAATGALADAVADVISAGGSGRGSVFEEQPDSPARQNQNRWRIELPDASLGVGTLVGAGGEGLHGLSSLAQRKPMVLMAAAGSPAERVAPNIQCGKVDQSLIPPFRMRRLSSHFLVA